MSEYKPSVVLIKELNDGVKINISHNRYRARIYFNGVPSKDFREFLKLNKWWYNHYNHYWDRQFSNDSWNSLVQYCKLHEKQKISDRYSVRIIDDVNRPFDMVYAPVKVEGTEITYKDTVIRSDEDGFCEKRHRLTNIIGLIRTINKVGTVSFEDVTVSYCRTCNQYYMSEKTYHYLKSFGVIGCKIMTKKQLDAFKRNPGEYGYGWEVASPLRCFGYSVSESSGVNTAQRRAILREIVNEEVLTKGRLVSYFDFFLNSLHGSKRAKSLWLEDRQYVLEYL